MLSTDQSKEIKSISVVVPLFNEEGSVFELHREILAGLEKLNRPFEVIFVNDGSTDKTEEECRSLSPLTLINFRKNFGQTAALDCGFKRAKNQAVIALDGDRQNDPADFSLLVSKLEDGYDIVSGWRKKRKDSFSKIIMSRGADFLRRILIDDGIHDSGCTLKIYRRECFSHLDLYGEMHRFIPAILKIQGFKVGEVEVNHRPRTQGVTKYNWKRAIKGFLDMVSVWFWKKYANRPLHLFGGLGILFSFFGGLLLLFSIFMRLFRGVSLYDKIWPIMAVFMILAGMQFFISGLLADIAVKNYYKGRVKNYSVKEVVDL
jgi:glycosyltransferase involved in cell wall biosynthesis